MAIKNLQSPPPRSAPFAEPGPIEVFSQVWSAWFRSITEVFNGNLKTGFTGTVTTAKLTPGGTNGSMVFTNGILTSQTQAT